MSTSKFDQFDQTKNSNVEGTFDRKQRSRKLNLKSRIRPDVSGSRTRSVQKSREARRSSRGGGGGQEAGAAGAGDKVAAENQLQLPPRVQPGTAAAVVRRAAATLAWAAGDGSVLSTAETLIARLHPRDTHGRGLALVHGARTGAGGVGGGARAGVSALQGSFNIPTLPPSALLRPPPSSTETLVQALRRQQQRERLADPRNMRRFLDAVIYEYVGGPVSSPARPQAPPSRSHRPTPKQLQLLGAARRAKELGWKTCSRGNVGAGLIVSRASGSRRCPSYETLMRRVEKPLPLRALPAPSTAPASSAAGTTPAWGPRRRSGTRGASPAVAVPAAAGAAPPPQPLPPSRKALAAK